MKVSWKDFVKCANLGKISASNTATVPAKVTGKNNDFNLRHYYQGWLGEDTNGLNRGDMLNFTSKKLGWRAGARNARNMLMKLKAGGKVPSIRNFAPLYSPAKGDFSNNENNTARHMKNISKLSVIGLDDPINPDDESQFFKFLTGLAMSESGSGALKGMTYNDIMNAIRSGRKSVKTK